MARQKKDIPKKKPFTTLLPEEITKEIKHIAVQKGKKYYEVIEEALKDYVAKEGKRKAKL